MPKWLKTKNNRESTTHMTNEIATTLQTVRDLRHRWKPHKERLHAAGGDQPTAIRFHRACSWMARVEAMPEGQDHDLGLVSLWIAFNSLYGQWDAGKLNRTSLMRCVVMMQRLLPALLGVWIDHGSGEDWGPMCYPPMDKLPGSVGDGNGRPGRPR